MTEKDRKLIQKALGICYTDWMLIDVLIQQADTQEAIDTLGCIKRSKYHTDEYYAGMQ